jgi:hypothetical protein
VKAGERACWGAWCAPAAHGAGVTVDRDPVSLL